MKVTDTEIIATDMTITAIMRVLYTQASIIKMEYELPPYGVTDFEHCVRLIQDRSNRVFYGEGESMYDAFINAASEVMKSLRSTSS